MSKKNIRTLEEFSTEHYGKKGTPKRDKPDKGYAEFKLGVLVRHYSTIFDLQFVSLKSEKRETNTP